MTPNRSAKIIRFVYDDEYELCLGIGELEALEEARDIGFPLILSRLQSGTYSVKDIHWTIRLALQGGGMAPVPAKKFAERAVLSGYLLDYAAIAMECLYAAMVGAPEDTPDLTETTPGEPMTPPTTEDASPNGQATSTSPGSPDTSPPM